LLGTFWESNPRMPTTDTFNPPRTEGLVFWNRSLEWWSFLSYCGHARAASGDGISRRFRRRLLPLKVKDVCSLPLSLPAAPLAVEEPLRAATIQTECKARKSMLSPGGPCQGLRPNTRQSFSCSSDNCSAHSNRLSRRHRHGIDGVQADTLASTRPRALRRRPSGGS
jgi:hypothetical protein